MHSESICEVLKKHNELTPEKAAFDYYVTAHHLEHFSYRSLYEQAQKRALLVLKIASPGDRIIIANPPGAEFIINLFACFYSGIIAVPAFPPSTPVLKQRLDTIIRDCNPICILDQNTRFLSNPVALALHSFKKRFQFGLNAKPRNDIALIQYTSGSTSDPKGIILTHANIVENLKINKQLSGMSKRSKTLSWLPPYHDMGLIGGILTPLYSGAFATLMPPSLFLSNPFFWLKTMSDNKTSISVVPDFALNYCVDKISDAQVSQLNLSHLRYVFNGSEPINPKTLKCFYNKFKGAGFNKQSIKPCYGLAEATLLVSGTPKNEEPVILSIDQEAFRNKRIITGDKKHEIVSCGTPKQIIKIVDIETKTEVPEGHIGEIWVTGACIAKAYWGKPEESQRGLHAVLNSKGKAQDFLTTGDLGFVLDNRLYITGRIKDTIIIRGKNYYAYDIEYSLAHIDPLIKPGHLIALSNPESEMLHEESLFVLCGVQKFAKNIPFEAISLKIISKIQEDHQISPQKIIYVPKNCIQKTSSGKIRRQPLKDALRVHSMPVLFEYTSNLNPAPKTGIHCINPDAFSRLNIESCIAYFESVISQIKRDADPLTLSEKTRLYELGLSSLEQIQFFTRLESELNSHIPLDRVDAQFTLLQLIKLIKVDSGFNHQPNQPPQLRPSKNRRLLKMACFLKEKYTWFFIVARVRLYHALLQPQKYKTATLFRFIGNAFPYFKSDPRERMRFASKLFFNFEFSRHFFQISDIRTTIFQEQNYFPYTSFQLNNLLHTAPKPSILLFFHFTGWRCVLFFLIKAAITHESTPITLITDSRAGLLNQLKKEFELFYGRKWTTSGSNHLIHIVDTWSSNLAIQVKHAMNNTHLIVLLPDTELAYSGIGYPVSIPVFNHQIMLSTGILKLASERNIPLIPMTHYLSNTGIHLSIATPVIIKPEHMQGERVNSTVENLLTDFFSILKKHPEQWMIWARTQHFKSVDKDTFGDISSFLTATLLASVPEGDNIIELRWNGDCFRIMQFSKQNYPYKKEGIELSFYDLEAREAVPTSTQDKQTS